jgi:hypothetical protein
MSVCPVYLTTGMAHTLACMAAGAGQQLEASTRAEILAPVKSGIMYNYQMGNLVF